MSVLIDKGMLVICCVAVLFSSDINPYCVIYLLIAFALSLAVTYISSRTFTVAVSIAYGILSLFFPPLCCFFPLFLYDLIVVKSPWPSLLFLFSLVNATWLIDDLSLLHLFLVCGLCGVAGLLSVRTTEARRKTTELNSLRDGLTSEQRTLKKANHELMDKQDYEVHVAILGERNRISRELHDSIGHVLTRSILQAGALSAVANRLSHEESSEKEAANNTEELSEKAQNVQALQDGITALQASLSDGMTQIRESIHNLHEDSMDMKTELEAVLRGFTQCPVELTVATTTLPPKNIRFAMISIVKECMSNVTKHAPDATQVTVTLREHPVMWQLIIEDNGEAVRGKDLQSLLISQSAGIGITSIRARVEELHGRSAISTEDGFCLHITFPKEDNK